MIIHKHFLIVILCLFIEIIIVPNIKIGQVMNYLKTFYDGLKYAIGSDKPRNYNPGSKTNNKYSSLNNILHPVFKDEYNVLKQIKYENLLKKSYNNKNYDTNYDTNYSLEKDELKSLTFVNYYLKIEPFSELNKQNKNYFHTNSNTDTNNTHEKSNNYELNNDLDSDNSVCSISSTYSDEDSFTIDMKKNQTTKQILIKNILIGFLLIVYFTKNPAEK
jgi:hypothetical protein